MSRRLTTEDSRRRRLTESIFALSTIEHVSEQIALFAAPRFPRVYVERRGDAYRWSIAHRGGFYPLLRELALLLRVPYTSLVIPFRTVEDCTVLWTPDID